MQIMYRKALIVPVFVILVQCSNGIIYGPSLEFLTTASDSSSLRRIIRLADYGPHYSVVVPLAANKTMAEPRLVRPVGEFTVEAPENTRIMAVIQSLHLRTKSVTSAFPPVCRDYILFDDDSLNKICGTVQKNDRKGSPNGIMGDRTYFSQGNMLNVTIFTDMSTFVEDWMMTLNIVEIAFTAYQDCPIDHMDEHMMNCLDSVVPHGPSCIPSNLTCDGVINCGFLMDGNFGKDEANCPAAAATLPTTNENNSVPTTVPPPAPPPPTTVSTTTTSTPKTGFPSWWENWRKMSNERVKLLNLDLQYGNSNKVAGDSNHNNHNHNNKAHDQVEIHTRFFEPEFKNNSSYFNSFVLYTLCFFVGVSGISVILKMLTRYCGERSSSVSDSGSSLMQDGSSATSVVIDGDLRGVSRSAPACTTMDICDYDPPPPYESLFPVNPTNNSNSQT